MCMTIYDKYIDPFIDFGFKHIFGKNNNFIVELQRSKQKYFKDRALYYTSFPIQEQSHRGDWDYKVVMDYAREEAEEKGMEIGMEIGMEKGREVGAKDKQLEIAKSLLDILDIEIIALKTGLSKEDIKALGLENK